MKILLVDNFDSFTYNIADYLAQLGAEVEVIQRTKVKVADFDRFDGIVFSPGPGNPEVMTDLLLLISAAVSSKPALGICLGFQAIALVFDAKVEKGTPMHGKISKVKVHKESWLFQSVPSEFEVVRYHSLRVSDLKDPLLEIAVAYGGELMAFQHKDLPIAGIQYHPEAYLTNYGHQVFQNWLNLC